MTIHASIDIETFATSNQPPIVSIGACKFDPDGDKGKVMEDPFYQTIGWKDATEHGKVDSHTLMWWLTQDSKAIAALDIDGQPLLAALLKLQAWWYADVAPTCIWSHTFDTVALRSAYAAVEQDIEPPWHYRAERDIRTLVELWKRQNPGERFTKEIHADKHHALADAIYQADYVQGMLQDMDGEPNKLGLTPKDIAKQVSETSEEIANEQES